MSVLVMQPVQTRSGFLQKQIPTLVGVVVLVAAMIAGLLMFSEGTGVFAPRATPQTTPKQVKITNVADKAFTISFYTDEATAGFVKYGTTDADLSAQASDDRDQLSGTVGKYSLHHITLKGLKPNTQYFFTLGTGSGVAYDNNGSPFTIKTTAEVSGPPPVANTIYGTVTNAGGTAAEGSVVYLAIDGVNELSALVKASGSWAIPLASARNKSDGGYANLKDDASLNIFVQGAQLTQTTQTVVALKDAQPVADLALGGAGQQMAQLSNATSTTPGQETDQVAGQTTDASASDSAVPSVAPSLAVDPEQLAAGTDSNTQSSDDGQTDGEDEAQPESQEVTPTQVVTQQPTPTPTTKAADVQASAASTASAVLNLSEVGVGGTAVTNQAPKIIGQAPPRTQVKIEVHSDTEITETITTTDGGNFELDLAQYQNLEPGEHTVTITYVDPQTGQEVTQTRTFIVEDSRMIALGQGGDTPPYGSGNPYPVTSPTPTLAPSVEPTPTTVVASTPSADTSTRSAVVSTSSGTYNSGSVGMTFALIGGGLFFILTGLWSWWLAGHVREETA